jgi:hypothetical protein
VLAERARVKFRSAVAGSVLVAAALVWSQTKPTVAQSTTPAPEATQKIDERYTQIVRQNLQDPRITTELVDHLPASDTVPTPLRFFGRAVGTPSELTYARDIHRYYEALAKASPRAKYLKIGTSEGLPRLQCDLELERPGCREGVDLELTK